MATAAASTPSPASNNNSSDTTAVAILRMETPSKTLRGLNKPKCIQCGNVARSRCPYQCCKSCCFKAQNPCHIHVLKLPPVPLEKQTSNLQAYDQQPSEPSPPLTLHRPATRQPLQANAYKLLFSSTRPKKPLTKREAIAINEWRLSKLKEFNGRKIELENDAFDRYMSNVKSLEEIFSMTSHLVDTRGSTLPNSSSGNLLSEDNAKEVDQVKLKLNSNDSHRKNVRNKMKKIVVDGLQTLEDCENDLNSCDPDFQFETDTRPKKNSSRSQRMTALNDLLEKLNRSRNEDDLKSCMELKSQLYSQEGIVATDKKDATQMEEEHSGLNSSSNRSCDSLAQKVLVTTQIDEKTLARVHEHFCSLDKIGRL